MAGKLETLARHVVRVIHDGPRRQPRGPRAIHDTCFAKPAACQRFRRLNTKRGRWRTTNMISAHCAGA